MQRKKRTKSKLVKQFMNFLLAIALGISLLQLPQLSKEVKAECKYQQWKAISRNGRKLLPG